MTEESDKLDIIKKTIEGLLKRMGLSIQVSAKSAQEDNLVFNIETEEAGFLIGQAGINLDALQHLARLLVSKKTGQPIKFVLDVNNYRQHRVELLEELADKLAKQAITERVTLTLQPMPAFERRIIHLVLAGRSEVVTESIGEEPQRRIIVKPNK